MISTRQLVWIAGLAGLLAGASLTTHRRREGERRISRAKPEPLQTWEGEGGAVPMRTGRTAQQVTPSSGEIGSRVDASDTGPHEKNEGLSSLPTYQ